MSKLTNKEYARALYECAQGLKGSELDAALEAFARMLFRDQKLKQAAKILTEFEQYAKRHEGIVSLKITSARELDGKTLESIKKMFGEKVEAVTQVDPQIIGGVIVHDENKIFDASLKTQLNKLKQSLV